MFVGIPFAADHCSHCIQFQIVVVRDALNRVLCRAVAFTLARIGFDHVGHVHADTDHRMRLRTAIRLEFIVGVRRFGDGCSG